MVEEGGDYSIDIGEFEILMLYIKQYITLMQVIERYRRNLSRMVAIFVRTLNGSKDASSKIPIGIS